MANIEPIENTQFFLIFLGPFLGAFFAFMFFLFGEKLKDRRESIGRTILALTNLKEQLLWHIYSIESARKKLDSIDNSIESISLTSISKLTVEEKNHFEIGNYKVLESIYRYFISIRILNDNIRFINEFNNQINKMVIAKAGEEGTNSFIGTISKNKKQLIEAISKNKGVMDLTQKNLNELFPEIEWTLRYLQSGMIKKLYTWLRIKLRKDYRKEEIKKIYDKNTNEILQDT